MQAPPPLLWSDDEIETRDDGFLWVIKEGMLVNNNDDDDDEEQQPLLLHSTEILLQALYPSWKGNKAEILKEQGFETEQEVESKKVEEEEKVASADSIGSDDHVSPEDMQVDGKETDSKDSTETIDDDAMDIDNDEVQTEIAAADNNDTETGGGAKKKSNNRNKKPQIPQEYKMYQMLKRSNNLSARIQSALLDIQYSRNRTVKKQRGKPRNRELAKVRALEAQQQRLLQQQQSSASGDGSVEEDQEDILEEEAGEDVREPQSIRLIRTINSIRALYPHLLPMLNHARRNDKQLVIQSAQWKSKKRAMCWILGRKVFDTTTNKQCINAHMDARIILEGYIPVDVAEQIADDPLGSPLFWKKWWIPQILERASPKVVNPLWILGEEEDHDIDKIRQAAWQCDEQLHLESAEDNTPEIQTQYENAVNKLHQRIANLLTKRFPGARVSVYGSCLSNLSLGKGADVDLSLWIPEAEKLQTAFHKGEIEANRYEREMKKFVYQACRKLENLQTEFRGMQPVTRARVPVVKGTHNFANNPYSEDGSINFDVCFLNDIAVANSGLLREYSLVDPRVRNLMMAVKQWAKEYNINSAKDNFISSYAWINLVIFYLQCLGFVPNLQNPQLMETCGLARQKTNYWHNVNKLDTCTLKWADVQGANAWTLPVEFEDMPVSGLLYGFFEFYSRRFPAATFAVSTKKGAISVPKLAFRKQSLFYCIEDPFETFDSHCPHDLGTPAGENGTRDIFRLLREGEAHLRNILCGKAGAEEGLWPKSPFEDPQSTKKNATNPQFTRFGKEVEGGEHKGTPGQGRGRNQQQKAKGAGQHRDQNRGNRGGRGPNQNRGGRGRQQNQRHHPGPKRHDNSQANKNDEKERGSGKPSEGSIVESKGDNEDRGIAMKQSQGNQQQNHQKGKGKVRGGGKGDKQQNSQNENAKAEGDNQTGNKKKGGKPKHFRNKGPRKNQPADGNTAHNQ